VKQSIKEHRVTGLELHSSPPIIRWAGGKRKLVNYLTKFLPENYNTYHEPMIGGGALFFALRPKHAVLGDINPDLINFYQILKKHPSKLYEAICRHRPNKSTYYSLRSVSPKNSIEKAARFLFLNRLSWNGLYRVNKAGRFNVPYGQRIPKQEVSFQNLRNASRILKLAKLRVKDFQTTTIEIEAGDLVFLDPPYPKGALNGNGFTRYSAIGFSLIDHERLARYAANLADRGIHVLITMAGRKEILKLYSKSFSVTKVRTSSLIAADPQARRETCEAILTSYPIPKTSSN